jgi:hypothetical protein
MADPKDPDGIRALVGLSFRVEELTYAVDSLLTSGVEKARGGKRLFAGGRRGGVGVGGCGTFNGCGSGVGKKIGEPGRHA